MPVGVSNTRVSNSLMAQAALRSINYNMGEMLDIQYQMASGLRLYKPSIDPGGAAVALSFQAVIERQTQEKDNIARSNEFLANTDSALGDLQDILNQAAEIASTNIGSSTDDTSRQNAATVVGSLISQLAQLANRQYNGRYLFAGSDTVDPPFDLTSTRVSFTGDIEGLYALVDRGNSTQYNVSAEEAFGTLTGRVTSTVDLDPGITASTRLGELNGGDSVRLGTIILDDGTNSVQVDLSGCDTVGQVITTINNNGVVAVTAGINAATDGFEIQVNPGDTLSVNDVSGGYTARDLGILQQTPLGAGVDLVGTDVNRVLTLTTELASLRSGAGIDQASGMQIRVGPDTVTIDLSTATTMEDLLNSITFSGLDVVASIDDAGERLVISNRVASESLYVAENGGTTATDLGVRSMTPWTQLSDLNGGAGVRVVEGADDLNIITKDGSAIGVNLDGAVTVVDVIQAINLDPDNAGRVAASVNPDGNGLWLQDMTAGGNNFRVERINSSYAAVDLGINKTMTNPEPTLVGDDVAPVEEQGVFRYLFDLREALLANDNANISRAGSALQGDVSRVARIRGSVGVRMQSLESTQTRLEDEQLQIKGLLSEVRDLDYADAVARFQTLQSTFQASLHTAATTLPLSLMDFLR